MLKARVLVVDGVSVADGRAEVPAGEVGRGDLGARVVAFEDGLVVGQGGGGDEASVEDAGCQGAEEVADGDDGEEILGAEGGQDAGEELEGFVGGVSVIDGHEIRKRGGAELAFWRTSLGRILMGVSDVAMLDIGGVGRESKQSTISIAHGGQLSVEQSDNY